MKPASAHTNLRKHNNMSMNRFENSEPEDYVELEAARGVKSAKEILVIEDASELAKSYIFEENVFERIMKDLTPKEYNSHCATFGGSTLKKRMRCTVPSNSKEIMHIAYNIPRVGGHYAAGIKSGNSIVYFDSMCSEYRQFMEKYMKKRYGPNIKIRQNFNKNLFQPSGGFVPNSPIKLKKLMEEQNVNTQNIDMNSSFHISQYDVLSQHHFCYVESLIYLCHKILGTPIGTSSDPEIRLRFVKSVLWSLIFKYVNIRPSRKFEYFKRNFPYYMKTSGVRYISKGFYIKNGKSPIRHSIKRIHVLDPRIAKLASLKFIIKWAHKFSIK